MELVISDQSDAYAGDDQAVRTLVTLLQIQDRPVRLLQNLPRKGIAHQRQFLLEQATGPYSLFLDDDVILEPEAVQRMVTALQQEAAGFCGMAPIGLSYLHDVRPHQQQIEIWEGPVRPETIRPGEREWYRFPLHSAANMFHAAQNLMPGRNPGIKYKIAWVGGCVLFDTAKLRATGGFDFWQDLPQEHCGEDAMAQMRLMEQYGGFGLLPSGAYHLELPTTVVNREVNAPEYLQKP